MCKSGAALQRLGVPEGEKFLVLVGDSYPTETILCVYNILRHNGKDLNAPPAFFVFYS